MHVGLSSCPGVCLILLKSTTLSPLSLPSALSLLICGNNQGSGSKQLFHTWLLRCGKAVELRLWELKHLPCCCTFYLLQKRWWKAMNNLRIVFWPPPYWVFTTTDLPGFLPADNLESKSKLPNWENERTSKLVLHHLLLVSSWDIHCIEFSWLDHSSCTLKW